MPEGAWLLGFLTLQRLAELLLARRNTARLLASGAYEVGRGHYPLIVALHAAWLAALWLAGWDEAVARSWLVLFVVLQALRVWVLATLGPRWTTRVIVVSGESLVARGPFRFLRHPNYTIVVAEFIVVPMALGLPALAVIFTLANAALLSWRIRVENAALAGAAS